MIEQRLLAILNSTPSVLPAATGRVAKTTKEARSCQI